MKKIYSAPSCQTILLDTSDIMTNSQTYTADGDILVRANNDWWTTDYPSE